MNVNSDDDDDDAPSCILQVAVFYRITSCTLKAM